MQPFHFVRNRKLWLLVGLVAGTLLLSVLVVTAQGPRPGVPLHATSVAGTGFTYQGQLKRSGAPVNDICNMQYSLWDDLNSGTRVGFPDESVNPVTVTNGLFTVQVNRGGNFGPTAFNGDARWLQIIVLCPGDNTSVKLSRQPLSASPYALYSIGNWGLNGNSGTTGANFLGTTDNVSLTIGVNGTAALRILPDPFGTALVGGYKGNTVGGSYSGATIGGGGGSGFGGNVISGTNVSWSTIAGGVNNLISGNAYNATIGGGYNNIISGTSDAGRAVIGGGWNNTASGFASTVSGGTGNTASLLNSTVSGGQNNTASNYLTTVGGGFTNSAGGQYATVGGGSNNMASNSYATVGGGLNNIASGYIATVGGGYTNTASGQYATVPGGDQNSATMANTLAAGHRAKAPYQGDFVWADDSSDSKFGDASANQFFVRASGGVYFYLTPDLANFGPHFILDPSGKATASGGFNGQCLTTPFINFNTAATGACNMDMAESFASTALTEPGDLVVLSSESNATPTVRKSAHAYEGLLIGVVSTNPGLVFDDGATHLAGDNSQLITSDKTVVALVGRVLVKVTLENGLIAVGDPLTSSSQPGSAMKATQPGKIIGYALESKSEPGKVLALVQPGYYLPTGELDTPQQTTDLKIQNAELKHEVSTLEARMTALEERANGGNTAANFLQVILALGTLVMLGVVYRQHRENRGGRRED